MSSPAAACCSRASRSRIWKTTSRPLGYDPSVIGIDRVSGSFFNRQARSTTRRKLSELYHFRPRDRHQLKAGFELGWEAYRGEQIFSPVTWLGIGDRPVLNLRYTDPVAVRGSKSDLSTFLQDKWMVNDKLTLDLGARLDRDSLSSRLNPSYRAGFAYAFGPGSRTVLRGGSGLFVDRISLLVPTFEQLPLRIETRFTPDGGIAWERRLMSRFDGPLRNAKSLGWNLQLDREVIDNLFLRTRLSVSPHREQLPCRPGLCGDRWSRDGWPDHEQRRQGLLPRIPGVSEIPPVRCGAYHRLVCSVQVPSGDLNDIGAIYGPTPSALIQPNERAPLRFDVPHRMMTWAQFNLPLGLTTIPVWEAPKRLPALRDR